MKKLIKTRLRVQKMLLFLFFLLFLGLPCLQAGMTGFTDPGDRDTNRRKTAVFEAGEPGNKPSAVTAQQDYRSVTGTVTAADWTVLPKNYTLFAVKYINEFHGTCFHDGSSTVKGAAGAEIESTTYSEKYVENNPTAKLVTNGTHIYEAADVLVTRDRGVVMEVFNPVLTN